MKIPNAYTILGRLLFDQQISKTAYEAKRRELDKIIGEYRLWIRAHRTASKQTERDLVEVL